MYREILNNEDLVALRVAYNKACEQLGLGTNADDTGRREHLAMLMLSLAKGGERDANMIRIQAVHQMQARGQDRPPDTSLKPDYA